jgi:hypothetical protein
MRWNGKTRKMFIFIVSLLLVLQAVAIIGSAGAAPDSLGNSDPDADPDGGGNVNNTEEEGKEDTSSGSNSGSSGSGRNTFTDPSYYSPKYPVISELDTSINDDKYNAYAAGLNSGLDSKEPVVGITSSYFEETNELEVLVTSKEGKALTDVTVEVIGQKYTTDISGSIRAPVLPEIVKNTHSVLVEASINDGHSASTYASLKEGQSEQSDTDDGFLVFIRQIDSPVLRNILMMLIQSND